MLRKYMKTLELAGTSGHLWSEIRTGASARLLQTGGNQPWH